MGYFVGQACTGASSDGRSGSPLCDVSLSFTMLQKRKGARLEILSVDHVQMPLELGHQMRAFQSQDGPSERPREKQEPVVERTERTNEAS